MVCCFSGGLYLMNEGGKMAYILVYFSGRRC